jgi:hypothetical protein
VRVSTSVIAPAVVAFVLGAAITTSAAAAPRPALGCGDTVTGAAVLTTNLRCTTGPGLVLAPGATLDLQGHTLTGPGASTRATGLDAVLGSEADAVRVHNGTVRGWSVGLNLMEGRASGSVDAMTFRDNRAAVSGESLAGFVVTRSRFIDNDSGVGAFYVSNATVERSTFRGNTTAVGVSQGSMTVTGSTFTDNDRAASCGEAVLEISGSTLAGSEVAAGGYVCRLRLTGNTVRDNEVGVASWMIEPGSLDETFWDEIVGNRFTRNGVAVDVRVNTLVQGNTFVRNDTGVISTTYGHELYEVRRISLDGNRFDRNGDAVYVDSDVLVKDTLATRNTGYGIYTPRASDLGGNVAWGNGTEPQCTGVVCTGTGS